MRTVIYDPEDMEPLTVIQLAPWAVTRLVESTDYYHVIRFPIPAGGMPRWSQMVHGPDFPDFVTYHIADIQFTRCNPPHGVPGTWWVGLAMNPEVCLLLRSVFLAGQNAELQRHVLEAFEKGANEGIRTVLGLGRQHGGNHDG